MVNSKEVIPPCESMVAARHASVKTHLEYAAPDDDVHAKQYRAMAGSAEIKMCSDTNEKIPDMVNVDKTLSAREWMELMHK
mmetsp:Transcript_21712/g.25856  ORF Transcript_21712/g.25856 Transcript_21712/m.25856 type:complete len:81 (+) Transcript_21712:412-654(+)